MRAEHFLLHGLPVRVINSRPEIRTEDVIRRLGQALDLLAAHAPQRYRRLRTDRIPK